MASMLPGWLARARLALVVTAVVASVAGCVGMPDSGSPGTFGATPQATAPDSDFIGAIPAGPAPNWSPSQIVTGFLNASASYPTYKDIARQYLDAAASARWDPSWSVHVVDRVSVPGTAGIQPDGKATVDVTGTVRASFNGTGQYVAAAQNGSPLASQHFILVKVHGQWRITNPLPDGRMLTDPDFSAVYKPQDLYFFGPGGDVLVPDSVFVPGGTSPNSLVSNLVNALLNNPQTPWLQTTSNLIPPATTAFPAKTRLLGVSVDGTTATVNLGGAAASAPNTVLERIAAQLVWTLTGQQQTPQSIQAVQLERDGQPWIPPRDGPCGGTGGQGQSPAQKLAMYGCYDPYPAVTAASFYYVDGGQAWSRCAAESQVSGGFIGPVLPLFSRHGAAQPGQPCRRDSVSAQSPAVPPPQPRSLPQLSMVTASPDGKYAAGVSPGGNSVQIWASGATKPSGSMKEPGIAAISWDRYDHLWVAQSNATWMMTPGNSGSSSRPVTSSFGGKLIGMSVAPDGVRVAAIVQTPSGHQVDLAAINGGVRDSGQRGNLVVGPSIGSPARLGPNLADPIALTWYDADDLLVLDHGSHGNTLWEVPVDGQPAVKSPGVPPGAVSIAADSAQNAVVVGLAGGALEVSAGLEGPWQQLGSGGQNPVFPAPQPRDLNVMLSLYNDS